MDNTFEPLPIAGVDEAGRGPLAGPVVAAAVILNSTTLFAGLTDSKLLSEKKREHLYTLITENCVSFAIAQASVDEIDTLNILQATLLAMRRAIAQLTVSPAAVWVDGNQDPRCGISTHLYVKGDLLIPCISAASILAKVTRDRLMKTMHEEYPDYGFSQHKGYGTAQHMAALQKLGVTPHHRRSFAPVAERV